MNKWLLLLSTLLLTGTALGYFMQEGSGYILISFQHWTFETSLWVFLILLLGSVLFLYFSIQVFMAFFRSPDAIKSWRRQRGSQKAVGKTVKGLIALAEGNWKLSEKLLLSGAVGKGKIINYLAAARAAHQSGNYEHSDQLLADAAKSTKGAELAVGLQQAQLQLDRKQFEQCLATCLRLKKQFPKHQYVNKMLLTAHMELEDWQAVLELLPKISKHKLLPYKKSNTLEIKAYGKLIEHLIHSRNSSSKDPKALLKVWKGIPNRTIKHLDFIPLAKAFIEHMISLGAHVEAEAELRQILSHHWSPELVGLYGCIKGKDLKRQLTFAKSQLNLHPNDAALLLTLGRLSLSNEQFNEAQTYFEQSLNLEGKSETRADSSKPQKPAPAS